MVDATKRCEGSGQSPAEWKRGTHQTTAECPICGQDIQLAQRAYDKDGPEAVMFINHDALDDDLVIPKVAVDLLVTIMEHQSREREWIQETLATIAERDKLKMAQAFADLYDALYDLDIPRAMRPVWLEDILLNFSTDRSIATMYGAKEKVVDGPA